MELEHDPSFFNRQESIKDMEKMINHSMRMVRWAFKFFPQMQFIPVEVHYPLMIFLHNMLVYKTFVLCCPQEIQVDYR
jgi:hypothetical protein